MSTTGAEQANCFEASWYRAILNSFALLNSSCETGYVKPVDMSKIFPNLTWMSTKPSLNGLLPAIPN